MTKEELKQEAKEWSFRKEYAYGYAYTFKQVIDAYIEGAEPREKRITELESKIKHLTEHLEPQAMSALFEQVEEEVKHEQRIKELEKKNAELRETNEKLRYDFGEGYIQDEKEFWEKTSYLENKLTKAKELLKTLIENHITEPEVFSDGSCEDNELFELRKEIEQFLKESEK